MDKENFYKPQKEEIFSDVSKKGKFLRESDTRILIDRKLRESAWDIEDKSQVSTEEPTKTGRADYLLKDRRSRPLCIIA